MAAAAAAAATAADLVTVASSVDDHTATAPGFSGSRDKDLRGRTESDKTSTANPSCLNSTT